MSHRELKLHVQSGNVQEIRAVLKRGGNLRVKDEYIYNYSPDVTEFFLSRNILPRNRRNVKRLYNSKHRIILLVKNGVRLITGDPGSFVEEQVFLDIAFARKEYEQCRRNIIFLLTMKKRGVLKMDRFLVRELAYVIYASRYEYRYKTRLPYFVNLCIHVHPSLCVAMILFSCISIIFFVIAHEAVMYFCALYRSLTN